MARVTTTSLIIEDDPTDIVRQPLRVPTAIFDLDRTILPGSSLPIVAAVLRRGGLLPRRVVCGAMIRNAVFQRRGHTGSTVGGLASGVLGLIEGWDVDMLRPLLEEAQRELVFASRPELCRQIERHRDAGDHCVVLTASPVEIAELVAAGLGAHQGVGTRSEIIDGRYTGRLAGTVCYGPRKLDCLAAEHVLPLWSESTAYSDAASDLPLLKAVGRPIVVTPDRELRLVAATLGWPTLEVARRRQR